MKKPNYYDYISDVSKLESFREFEYYFMNLNYKWLFYKIDVDY